MLMLVLTLVLMLALVLDSSCLVLVSTHLVALGSWDSGRPAASSVRRATYVSAHIFGDICPIDRHISPRLIDRSIDRCFRFHRKRHIGTNMTNRLKQTNDDAAVQQAPPAATTSSNTMPSSTTALSPRASAAPARSAGIFGRAVP
jgi:hypothetical protein